jgi:NADH-quinone oxidoreductase subunit M
MGGSAFLLIGILGIFYGAGGETMNLLEIAKLHIPHEMQRIFFPLTMKYIPSKVLRVRM